MPNGIKRVEIGEKKNWFVDAIFEGFLVDVWLGFWHAQMKRAGAAVGRWSQGRGRDGAGTTAQPIQSERTTQNQHQQLSTNNSGLSTNSSTSTPQQHAKSTYYTEHPTTLTSVRYRLGAVVEALCGVPLILARFVARR